MTSDICESGVNIPGADWARVGNGWRGGLEISAAKGRDYGPPGWRLSVWIDQGEVVIVGSSIGRDSGGVPLDAMRAAIAAAEQLLLMHMTGTGECDARSQKSGELP